MWTTVLFLAAMAIGFSGGWVLLKYIEGLGRRK